MKMLLILSGVTVLLHKEGGSDSQRPSLPFTRLLGVLWHRMFDESAGRRGQVETAWVAMEHKIRAYVGM